MPHFRIEGAYLLTGEDVDTVIEASDSEAAELWARDRRVAISGITEIVAVVPSASRAVGELPTSRPAETPLAEWISRTHLLLLSRFTVADDLNATIPSAWQPQWERLLHEPPQQALARFVAEGWLVPAKLPGKIASVFKASEIKGFLKERKLPVSGPKHQGIERLVAADREGMAAKVAHLPIYECSPKGKVVAERFLAAQREHRSIAEKDCMERLNRKDFQGAAAVVAQYEAAQVFHRGIGGLEIGGTRDIEICRVIFDGRPKILAGIVDAEWEPLRVAAAMNELWGETRGSRWLPADFVGIPKFDRDVAVRMMLFFALHRAEVADAQRSGVAAYAKILGSGDSCPACRRIAGKRFSLGEVPELPYEKCTSDRGCSCVITYELRAQI